MIAEVPSLADQPRDLSGYKFSPAFVALLNHREHVPGEDAQMGSIVRSDGNQKTTVDQVVVQMPQLGRDFHIVHRHHSASRIQGGIYQQFYSKLKKSSKSLENASFQIDVIFFFKYLLESGHAEDDADTLDSEMAQIRRDTVKMCEIRDQDHFAELLQQHGPGEKIGRIDSGIAGEVVKRHFHQDDRFLVGR